LTEKCI